MTDASALDRWLARIENSHPETIDFGLDRIEVVAQRLGIRAAPARVITVAGTNGKGSCVAVCTALLQAAGKRVGSYTSPHLRRYNERVRINGCEATDSELVGAFEAIEAARGEITLTYFEYGTLAAFVLFQQAALDVWVLEVGLGGRLDAVNLIDADVAVVTSIDIDHVDWLGSDREGIAFEKAGIFRRGRPAICADRMMPAAISTVADKLGARLLRIGDDFDVAGTGGPAGQAAWRWRSADGTVRQIVAAGTPRLVPDNLIAAVQAVAQLEALPSEALIAGVLSSCSVEGRTEHRSVRGVDIILDVAHNPAGTARLAGIVARYAPVTLVFAVMQDKDVGAMIDALAPHTSRWLLPQLDNPRARAPHQIAAMLSDQQRSAIICTSVAQALALALQGREQTSLGPGCIVVCGSFFTVGPALDYLDSLGAVVE